MVSKNSTVPKRISAYCVLAGAEAHHLDKQMSISIGESHGAVNSSSHEIERKLANCRIAEYICLAKEESTLAGKEEGLVRLR